MCRQASFPKNFSRNEALEILLNFENNNTDGFGYTYIDDNGKFVTRKWALSLSTLLKRGCHSILSHMPHSNGWTICHLRAASCGIVRKENSHPFEVSGAAGEWAITHNGHFSDHKLLRLALGSFINFVGETDSEVSANLIANIGPKKFSESIESGGVYFCLQKNGDLYAVKTTFSGDLALSQINETQVVLASELDISKYKHVEAVRGWYKFNKLGQYVSHKKKEYSYSGGNHAYSHVMPHHYTRTEEEMMIHQQWSGY